VSESSQRRSAVTSDATQRSFGRRSEIFVEELFAAGDDGRSNQE